jgi:hypothetical protein
MKEDRFVTGSGLSVHLAWQIIDNMGGIMETSSAPNSECTVKLRSVFHDEKTQCPIHKMPCAPTHFMISIRLIWSHAPAPCKANDIWLCWALVSCSRIIM